MSKFICLQAGHESRTSGSTGAPGEREANIRIRNRLSELLIEKGFMVQLVDADPTNKEIDKDFDLFLSLHCDADYPNDNGSGFADYPEPSTDFSTFESQRICKIVNEVYFPETKINYLNRSNKNTRFYYMWSRLSAKTPCVLIEMGQIQDPHDSVLLGNTELIAGALSKSISRALKPVEPEPDPVTPPTIPPTIPPVGNCENCEEVKKMIEDLEKRIVKLEEDVSRHEKVLQQNPPLLVEIQTTHMENGDKMVNKYPIGESIS